MINSKNNYLLVVLVFVVSTLFIQCKNQSKKTKSNKEDLVVSEDIQKSNFSKPKLNYNDLVNKTFLPVYLAEDGSYQYHGDISKEFDMGEDRIRFKRNKIMHLMPIEWYEYYIHKKKYDRDWLQINLIGSYNYHHKDTTNQSLYYFKYDKEKKLLFFSDRRTSDHLEVFMDSAYIALLERKKPVVKKENPLKKHIVYKKSQIVMNGKEIPITIPFVKGHLNEYGQKRFGEEEISDSLEAMLLRGKEKELFFVFGEGKCGGCPNFSALYDIKGNRLSYRYSRRMNARSSEILISNGDEDKIFEDYGFSDRDVNIQINHKDTPRYIIKDWY